MRLPANTGCSSNNKKPSEGLLRSGAIALRTQLQLSLYELRSFWQNSFDDAVRPPPAKLH
jgi:hypothetical protein